jgi:hypothetical protein
MTRKTLRRLLVPTLLAGLLVALPISSAWALPGRSEEAVAAASGPGSPFGWLTWLLEWVAGPGSQAPAERPGGDPVAKDGVAGSQSPPSAPAGDPSTNGPGDGGDAGPGIDPDG